MIQIILYFLLITPLLFRKTLTGTSTVGGVFVQVPAAATNGKKVKFSEALNEENVVI